MIDHSESERYGHHATRATRWRIVVNALDRLVPGWFPKDRRAVAGGMGQAAANTIRELVKERDEARGAAVAANRELERLREQRQNFVHVSLPPRYEGRLPELFAPYGGCQSSEPQGVNTAPQPIHSDAPRQNADGSLSYPQWERSYTRQVVMRLEVMRPWLSQWQHETLVEGIKLLRDYHATQHLVYEGRDKARKEADAQREENQKLRAELTKWKARTVALVEMNKAVERVYQERKAALPA